MKARRRAGLLAGLTRTGMTLASVMLVGLGLLMMADGADMGSVAAQAPGRVAGMTAVTTLGFGRLLGPGQGAWVAGVQICDARVNDTAKKLLSCVRVAGVIEHLEALQAIAAAHDGNRVAGSPGYDASVDYAVQVLEEAGYVVTTQAFAIQTSRVLTPPVLAQVAPAGGWPLEHQLLAYLGSGDVTATVSLPAGDAAGCVAADFAEFPAGNLALVRRGDCYMATKAAHAYQAGAAGVVIYNNTAGEIHGTLGADFRLDIPVTSVTRAVGNALATAAAAPDGLMLHLQATTFRGTAITHNVLAETPGGDPDHVVMVGAHLDSVAAGPGINDAGSGVAAILETAQQMARVEPVNQVRFALWAAEEAGLVGSTHYVESLSAAERGQIALYLNFDMIASPNYVYFVYDIDDSGGGAGLGPEGPAQIEQTFERYYASAGLPFKSTGFDGRSDHAAFVEAGIPAGGLFTGADGTKTAAEAAVWGGTAGAAHDPCYHAACDTVENINQTALAVNADGVAYATLYYAMRRD